MKKVSLALAVLALVGCKYDLNGNKNIIPADNTRTMQTSEPQLELGEETASVQKTAASDKLDASGNYIYDVGDLSEISLPDGTKMEVGKSSTENKLYSMLEDKVLQVSDDKTQGWITLDRVYFNTGSDELTSASQTQLKNIAAILKAYPESEVKLGGYTDQTGSQDINKPLSEGRAKSVMNMITNSGIDAARMSAEGYGSEHPICPANDTDECKAQNRRVDIRITKK